MLRLCLPAATVMELIADAQVHDWQREVERHHGVVHRLDGFFRD